MKFTKRIIDNRCSVTPMEATRPKSAYVPKKVPTVEELSEFCKGIECPWVRTVNFGNGVKVPHCVLRGGETKPHYRCKHLKEFMEFANISENEVEKVPMSADDEEEEEIETIREKD